jgi:UDP-glucuronate decarboxylase
VVALCGSKSRIAFRPLPEDDPKQRQPDIALARQRLQWEPKTPLEEGLRETIAYFRKTLRP